VHSSYRMLCNAIKVHKQERRGRGHFRWKNLLYFYLSLN
jgi:hypothetical protein